MISGVITTPSGQRICDLKSARGLKFRTISPGGCYTVSWEHIVPYPYIGTPLPEEDHCINLYWNGGLVYQGIVADVDGDIDAQSATWGITGIGYSTLFEEPLGTTAVYGRGYSIEQAFGLIRNELSSEISQQNRLMPPTGRTLSAALSTYVNKTGIEAFSDLIRFGNSSGNILTWHVWPGDPGGDGKPVLELRTKATTPKYRVSLGEGAKVKIRRSRKDQGSRVRLQYGDANAYVEAVSSLAESAWPSGRGRRRTLQVQVSQINSAIDANNMAASILAEATRRRARGNSIEIPAGTPIRDAASGGLIEPALVRAGEVIEITELKAAANYSYESQFYISQTEYEVDSGDLSLTPEGANDLTATIARLLRG